MEIITGYVGKPHVTSEQDRDVHIGIIGSGSYVLQTGKQMTAEISSNNEIKVRDGVLMHQGCAASIKKNTYDSLSIVNGSQGMKRIDLIVARYERNKNTGVESLTLKVLKGTPASANPATPAYTTGDIQAGDYIADMPMYKVTLDGINITKLEKQFQTVETNAALTQKVNVLNSTLIREKITFQAYISTTAIDYQNCYFIPAENKVHIELLLRGGSNAISYDGFICHADKKYMPSEARDLMMMYRTKEGNASPGYCFASHDTSRPYLWIKNTGSITMTDALILGEYAL